MRIVKLKRFRNNLVKSVFLKRQVALILKFFFDIPLTLPV